MRLLPDDPEIGWTPYAWLVYILSFVAYPALARASALQWGLTAAGLASFLVLYFWSYWLEGARGLGCAAGILLLGILFSPFNPGAGTLFVYAAAVVAKVVRPRAAWALLGGIETVIALEAVLARLSPYTWVPAAVFTLMIGAVCIRGAEVQRANARLRMAQEEVERLAKTAERERIARDLHDLLGHTLSLITLKAELAGKLVERDPERAGREIREVERISREALREVRTAVAGYRSEGLQAEMGRARLALEAAGVRLEYFAQPVALDPGAETVLALAMREAVTNVVRHAGARACRIAVEQTEAETRLEVSDDGRGGSAPEGIGLASMRERVEGLGGRLERRAETGTSLRIVLPRRKAAGEVVEIPARRKERPA
jgi:two-component system, NarL family, sensor histidine kinase DesK